MLLKLITSKDDIYICLNALYFMYTIFKTNLSRLEF